MSRSAQPADLPASTFARHAELARQERANPALIDDAAFQRKRHRAYRRFLRAFTEGEA